MPVNDLVFSTPLRHLADNCLTSNKPFDFGSNLDQDMDLVFFNLIFTTASSVDRIGAVVRLLWKQLLGTARLFM